MVHPQPSWVPQIRVLSGPTLLAGIPRRRDVEGACQEDVRTVQLRWGAGGVCVRRIDDGERKRPTPLSDVAVRAHRLHHVRAVTRPYAPLAASAR
ncbi:hypothetical protein Snoj_22940 [Streptomyces nojiriensis]|uniref:Uncharacterized protein n=1 Tax=Streptomyces nojiriensis TaxID=66374 RepID=A0ABQ3SJQ7_9ACTN|nr:hypothetical protein GCM10010205_59710 [Streptomyces nojiriensis]GHI68376.1 hypothetical protein Snoj_22940 [Streptomyces nojiriensis]